jgi:hypothetical protein
MATWRSYRWGGWTLTSDAAIHGKGPQITQAGLHNYTSTSLQIGFAGHPAAWRHGEVRYFRHAVTALP